MVRFFFDLVLYRYPGVVKLVLVYSLPWVLNSAWKIVKSWLDEKVQKAIVFVPNAVALQPYVNDASILPAHMGGTVSGICGYFIIDTRHTFTTRQSGGTHRLERCKTG